MDKLKQHFEKGILAIAMLAMGYVAFTLYSDADEQQTKIQEQVEDRERGRGRKVSWEVDMTPYTSSLAKLDNVQPLTLSNPHNLTRCSGVRLLKVLFSRWSRVMKLVLVL